LKKFHIRGKKDKAIASEPEPAVEEEVQIDSDPIMEEREDANESDGVPSEESRGSDERSPPAAESQEAEQKVVDSSEPTDNANDAGKVSPPTVVEEPVKEEASDVAKPADDVPKDIAQSLDEDMTLDADATSFQDEGCHTPANTPAFCGCFAN
jgi:hypothetical protein